MNIAKQTILERSSQLLCSAGLIAGMTCAIGSFQLVKINHLGQKNKNLLSTEIIQKDADKAAELKLFQKSPTLGFNNIAADAGFVQFLQYFGDDELRQKTNYRLSLNFFEAILAHDPYYKDFYFFLSSTTSVYAGDPESSVKLMDWGLAQMTEARSKDSYYVWRYKGIDELLFLGDSKAAQHSFQMAAKWASQIDTAESQLIAEASKQLAEALANNPDSKEVRINAWSNVLAATFDDATREKAAREIRQLGGDVIFSEDGGIKIKYSAEAVAEAKESGS